MAISITEGEKIYKYSKNESDYIKNAKKSSGYDPKVDTDAELSRQYALFKKMDGGGKGDDSNTTSRNWFQMGQEVLNRRLSDSFKNSGENITPKQAIEIVFDEKGDFKSFEEMLDSGKKLVQDRILDVIEQTFDLQRRINQETSLTGKLSSDWRDDIMMAYTELSRVGILFPDIERSMVKLIQDAGRFKLVNQETIELIGKTSKVFFDSMEDGVSAISEYQKVSKGAADAMESIKDVGLESLGLGLNAKETVKLLTENISKLNQYGFEKGEKGLAKMIKQAQQLKMDIGHAFKIAEDVMDPTKALDLAANIQVIGGAVSSFMDPIKMMYMATNNAEGLQQAIVDVAESLVSFDEESQTFKIMGADLRRARALADQMGMSLEELTNIGIQSSQRTSAAMDIMSTGLNVKDEDKEFLTNLAQMKGGKIPFHLSTYSTF